MRLWELVSWTRDEPAILQAIHEDPAWSEVAIYLSEFDDLVVRQDREKLDLQLPEDLCRRICSDSAKKYSNDSGSIVLSPAGDLTAIDVYESYGGNALEEISEHGSYRV